MNIQIDGQTMKVTTNGPLKVVAVFPDSGKTLTLNAEGLSLSAHEVLLKEFSKLVGEGESPDFTVF